MLSKEPYVINQIHFFQESLQKRESTTFGYLKRKLESRKRSFTLLQQSPIFCTESKQMKQTFEHKNRFFDATKHAIIWFSEYGVHSFFSGLLILQLFLDDYNRREKRWILHCSICRCTQYIIWLYRDYSIAQEMYFLEITPFPCLYFQARAVSDTSFCCIKITASQGKCIFRTHSF